MIRTIQVNLNEEAKKLANIGFHKGVVGSLESLRSDLIDWISDVEKGKKPLKSILVRFDSILEEQQNELKKVLKENELIRWWEKDMDKVRFK